MSDLLDPTRIPTALARQAAAADLWMQLTGRKAAAARALDAETAEKSAEYTQQEVDARMAAPGRYAHRGLIAGAVLGAGVAGLAARRFNGQEAARVGELARHAFAHPVTETAPAVSVGRAVLGGGLAGGAMGGLTGGVLGVRRALAPGQEEPAKQASAYEQMVEYLAARPALRAGAGAAALGVPMGALGYHLEKGKHTPGPGGVSPHNAGTSMDLARHDAETAAGVHGGVAGKARRYWLESKDQAAADASRHPRRSAAIGSIAYALPGALTGAGLASRVLK